MAPMKRLLVLALLAGGCGGSGYVSFTDDSDGAVPTADGGARDLAGLLGFDLRRGDAATPRPDLAADGWPPDWGALEDAVLVETNRVRAQGANCGGVNYRPAPPLVDHPALRKSARLHSKDMADNNYFNHNSLDGRTPFTRMRAAGFQGGTMGENIAAGSPTAAATVQQWVKSPGHCMNMMNPSYRYLGAGYAFRQASQYRHYWTQNFGG